MGFKAVYQCLADVFPQIDSRILKAVAIENSKDPDAAVEIVLSEVLPYLSKRSTVPVQLPQDSSLSDGEAEQEEQFTGLRRRRTGLGKTSGTSSETRSMINENANKAVELIKKKHWIHNACSTHQEKTLDTCTPVSGEPTVDTNQLKGNVESEEVILLKKPLIQTHNSQSGIILTSGIIPKDLKNEPNHCNTQVIVDAESEVAASLCNGKEINISDGHEHIPHVISTSLIEENGGSSYSQCEDGLTAGDFNAYTSGNNPQEESCLVSTALEVEDNVVEQTADTAESSLDSEFSTTPLDDFENVEFKPENKVDLLEEIIEAAKNNKKTLFLAMEKVMIMMRDVELQEKAAQQAKEEAARGGLDILVKVEELKKLLAHAKEGNDMHAGEIYGEKAILATEVRELQARLFSLSDERDKALAALDEMQQTLEGRLAAAEELRKAAEREKLEKERSAQKALAEQEAIMDKVVQESKILQQEAEENSKLREFLMDRGHVVDTLQGEISVICQDVRLLKEKFDERVPLSQSISSSQTSCILASSGSSLKSISSDHQLDETSKSMASDHQLDGASKSIASDDQPNEASKIPKVTSPTSSIDGLSPKSILKEGILVDAKEFWDDGWDIVE